MSASKVEILAAPDCEIEPVTVPEWRCTVNVRTMTGAERDALGDYIAQRREGGELRTSAGWRAMVVILSACDEAGDLLFTANDLGDLQKKSAVALGRVYDASARLNGLEADATEKAKADFPATPSGASGTASLGSGVSPSGARCG